MKFNTTTITAILVVAMTTATMNVVAQVDPLDGGNEPQASTTTTTSSSIEEECGVTYYDFDGSIDACQNGGNEGPLPTTLEVIADGECRKHEAGILGYHRAYCTGDGGIFFTEVHCKNDDCTDCGPRKNGLICTKQDYPKPFDTFVEGFCNTQTCDDPNGNTDQTIVFAIQGTCNPNVCPKYVIPSSSADDDGDDDDDTFDSDDDIAFTTSEILVLVVLIGGCLGCCFGLRWFCKSKNQQGDDKLNSPTTGSSTPAVSVASTTSAATPAVMIPYVTNNNNSSNKFLIEEPLNVMILI